MAERFETIRSSFSATRTLIVSEPPLVLLMVAGRPLLSKVSTWLLVDRRLKTLVPEASPIHRLPTVTGASLVIVRLTPMLLVR